MKVSQKPRSIRDVGEFLCNCNFVSIRVTISVKSLVGLFGGFAAEDFKGFRVFFSENFNDVCVWSLRVMSWMLTLSFLEDLGAFYYTYHILSKFNYPQARTSHFTHLKNLLVSDWMYKLCFSLIGYFYEIYSGAGKLSLQQKTSYLDR